MTTPQFENEVSLPIGYTDESGRLHREGVIRKIRGHEEALLYDPKITPGRLVTELIRGCLVRLGDLETPDSDMVSQLYTADRNYLLLELRRFTLGDRLTTRYQCPRCGTEESYIEDLSEVDVRRLADGETFSEITLELEDGYVDREGTVHTKVVLTLPRGIDEEFIAHLPEGDPLKAQDVLLLRCISKFGSLPKAALEGYGVRILRDLTLGDRLRLNKALNGETPGVDFQRAIQCAQCGATFEEVLDVSNFFSST